MEEGPLTGSYCQDLRVCIYDGKMHPVDSNDMAFMLASTQVFKTNFEAAKPQLLEPIMAVDVFTPEEHVGDVIGDLNRRRGMIKSQEAGAMGVRIKGDVPLSEMFGYIGHLRTMTSGRGQFSMEFSHYLPAPANVAEDVVTEVKARKEAKG